MRGCDEDGIKNLSSQRYSTRRVPSLQNQETVGEESLNGKWDEDDR